MTRITVVALLALAPTGCLSSNLRRLAHETPSELVQHATSAAQPLAHRRLSSSSYSSHFSHSSDSSDSSASSDSSSSSESSNTSDDQNAYLGCYLDEEGGALLEYAYVSAEMTLEMCYTECVGKGATYMGLKYGFLCSCGFDEEDSYTLYGSGECPYYCNGSGEENCGGTSSFDLYSLGEWDTPSTLFTSSTAHHTWSPTSSPSSYPTAHYTWSPTSSPSSSPTSFPAAAFSQDDDGYLTASPTLATPAPVTPGGPRAPTPIMPVAPPTPAPTPEVLPTASPAPATESPAESTSTTSTSEGSPTPADFSELLELHNEARCMHNADPLTWSDAVANSAALHAETLKDSCSERFHSDSEDRLGYGENLYVCWGSETCYSHEKAMATLYNGEVESDTVAGYGDHATQILWKSTTALGCVFAECTHGDTPYTYLICQYDPAGNDPDELSQEVELPSASGSC